MADGDRIKEFWAYWQHQPDAREQLERFRNRVLEVAKDVWENDIKKYDRVVRSFSLFSGTPYVGDKWPHGVPFGASGLYQLLKRARNLFEVAQELQFLLLTLESSYPDALTNCVRKLQRACELSPGVPIHIAMNGTKATMYPTGVKLLDEGVIEGNLVWLSKFPAVRKAFDGALQAYMTKDPKQYRSMLDNLRFAVEQMLQSVLGAGKTLENHKAEFLSWLKDHGVHADIRNMYHTLLFGYFTQYQNNAVKHHEDDYTAAEVEFVLYVTGTFLRLIQRLLEQDAATKATATS